MKTLFGIRSNVAAVIVGSLYLTISLPTSIYEIQYFQEPPPEEYFPNRYLLIDTNKSSFHILSLILSVTCLFSSILLILGILEKRYGILRPWLVFNFLLECIFVGIGYFLIMSFIKTYKSSWINASGLLLLIFFVTLATAFLNYIRNGIYKLYEKFLEQSRHFYRIPDGEDTESVHVV